MLSTQKHRHQLSVHERVIHKESCVLLRMKSTEGTSYISCDAEVEVTNNRLLITSQREEPGKYHVHGLGDRSFWALEVPLVPSLARGAISAAKLVQPWFGPQRWEAFILPARNSEFEPSSEWKLELSFMSGGAIDFSQNFASAAMAAATAKREQIDEVLPPYVP